MSEELTKEKHQLIRKSMMNTLTALKISDEGLEVEYEIASLRPYSNDSSNEITEGLNNIEKRITENQGIIDQLNFEIDKLTNHADGLDYTIAVASGILTGLIDSFFVGEFNFAELKADANKHVNKFVEGYAKLRGYEDKGAGLKGAIQFLEEKFPVLQDNYKGLGVSSSKLHHLEDIAHHPTILGLISSIGVSFFRTATFIDKEGRITFVSLNTDKKELIKIWSPIVISGVLRWLVHLAESKIIEKGNNELPKPLHKLLVGISYTPAIITILKVADNWFGHLVSDMGGSRSTAGGGMGIPGLFISFLKEISPLPFLKDTKLPQYVSDLYSKGKWDLRSEMAIMEYAGKQSIPVILNELLVRIFYFVRHLIIEYKKNNSWDDVNWDNVVPWRNRTITRMITIASGTLVAVDAADAAIRSALKSGGEPTTFFANIVLRINFVGIGRFAIAIGSDMYMGYKCNRLRNERMYRQSEQLMLLSAKLYYKESDMWKAAKDTQEAIDEMIRTAEHSMLHMFEGLKDIEDTLQTLPQDIQESKKYDPTLTKDLSDILEYGD